MKKTDLLKKMASLFAILLIVAFLSGCAGTTPAPNPNPTPATATLTIYSSSVNVYGYVWVNGFSTGKYIDYNGAVTVTGLTPGTLTSVQIKDNWGFSSHVEYITLSPGNNVLNFTYW